MTNASGTMVAEYTYDAYGNLTDMSGSEAAANPIRFSTKYFDGNTGYYDFGFRSYDPVTGRWLNRDPIGEEGGLNLYGFAGNSPGNVLDGYGLEPYTYVGRLTNDLAFAWYKGGQGRALAISLKSINTTGLLPSDFPKVRSSLSQNQVGCYRIDDRISFNVTNELAPVLGHVTLRLLGNLSIRKDGKWVFHGQLRSFADEYDFDASPAKGRGIVGETLTQVGSLAGALAHADKYNIYILGANPMLQVGRRGIIPQKSGVGASPSKYSLYLGAIGSVYGGN